MNGLCVCVVYRYCFLLSLSIICQIVMSFGADFDFELCRYLAADLTVTCYEGEHLRWVLGMGLPLFLLYIIGSSFLTLVLFPLYLIPLSVVCCV